jgi:hypothetical protein
MVVGLAVAIVDTRFSNTYDAFRIWVPDPQNGFSFETNEVSNPSTRLKKAFASMLRWVGDIDSTAEDPFDVEVWLEFGERLPRCYFSFKGP